MEAEDSLPKNDDDQFEENNLAVDYDDDDSVKDADYNPSSDLVDEAMLNSDTEEVPNSESESESEEINLIPPINQFDVHNPVHVFDSSKYKWKKKMG